MKLYTVPLSNFGNKSVIVAYEKKLEARDRSASRRHQIAPRTWPSIRSVRSRRSRSTAWSSPSPRSSTNTSRTSSRARRCSRRSRRDARRVRGFTRHHDLYLDPPMRALFFQMDPKTRNAEVVKQSLAGVDKRARLPREPHRLTVGGGTSPSRSPTARWRRRSGTSAGSRPHSAPAIPSLKRPKLKAWFERVQQRPSVKRALEAQGQALAAMMSGNR